MLLVWSKGAITLSMPSTLFLDVYTFFIRNYHMINLQTVVYEFICFIFHKNNIFKRNFPYKITC